MSLTAFKSTSQNPPTAKNLSLHSGAATGNLGLVKFALDQGQPIDSISNGVLPIHAACVNGNTAVVQYLIDHGADVNAQRYPRSKSGEKNRAVGTTGSTPLHFAAANGCTQTVELLLKNGAIVDQTDKYGETPLSVAIAKNYQDIVALLLKYGAKPRAEKADKQNKNNSPSQINTTTSTTATLSPSSSSSSPTNTTKSRRSSARETTAKIVKKIKKPLLMPTKDSTYTFKFSYISRRRPSLPAEFEKAEMNAAAAAAVETINDVSLPLTQSADSDELTERKPSRSMELSPYPLRRSVDIPSRPKTSDELSRDDFLSRGGDDEEDAISCVSDKPSIETSYSADEASPDSRRGKSSSSSTKELFRRSFTITRQLTSSSLTSLNSKSSSQSPDRKSQQGLSPVTNPSYSSLPLTPPDTPRTPSTTSSDQVESVENGGEPDSITLPPPVAGKKKRRSTDPSSNQTMNSDKWSHELSITRSMSESGLNLKMAAYTNSSNPTTPTKKAHTKHTSQQPPAFVRNLWSTLRGEKVNSGDEKISGIAAVKNGFNSPGTTKGFFGRFAELVFGRSL